MGLLKSLPPRQTKESDAKVLGKLAKKQASTQAVRGGNTLMATMTNVISLVERKLGKYAKQYVIISDEEELEQYFIDMVKAGNAAIDTETSSLNPLHAEIAGICLYARGLKPAYVPCGHISYITGVRSPNQLSQDTVTRMLEKYHKLIKWVMHNAVYDVSIIKYLMGVDIECWWDTYLAAKLLNENELAALKEQHKKYCKSQDDEVWSFSKLFGDIPFTKVPIKTAYLYAAGDGIKTLDLQEFQEQFMNRRILPGVTNVFRTIEMPLIPVIAEQQHNGIGLDEERCKTLSEKYHLLLDAAESNFVATLKQYQPAIDSYRRSNPGGKLKEPINLASPTQLAILLYDIMKLVSPDKKSPRGTGEEIISLMHNEVAEAILEWRGHAKLLDTYLDKLPKLIDIETRRIHYTLNSIGARTGRSSSEDPNLQNIPAKNEEIRTIFVARDDYDLISVDLSQQEPRTLAFVSQDPGLIQAYKDGKDLYSWIASVAYKVPYDECKEYRPDKSRNEVGAKRRQNMKSVVLGIMYSRGAKAIGEQLDVSTKEAQKIVDLFFETFPKVKEYIEATIEFARVNGYVETVWGRKCRIPDMQLAPYEFSYTSDVANQLFDPLAFDEVDFTEYEVDEDTQRYYISKLQKSWKFTDKLYVINQAREQGVIIVDNTNLLEEAKRKCVNSVIQGSAADMIKLGMIFISSDQELRDLGYDMLVPVHDEILGEAPKENCKRAGARVAELMVQAAATRITVPMKCDVEISHCWYGNHEAA